MYHTVYCSIAFSLVTCSLLASARAPKAAAWICRLACAEMENIYSYNPNPVIVKKVNITNFTSLHSSVYVLSSNSKVISESIMFEVPSRGLLSLKVS